jgi:uncharacterized protein (TIGR02246 family)
MSAFAALFGRNADFVNVLGMHWRGREEIEARHAVAHRTIFRNSTLRPESYGVRALTPTIALVHLNWQRWLITAAHNTEAVPIPVSK